MNGQCFCGSVSFDITKPTLWCGHCHCSMCQQIHGAGVVTGVGCEEESVVVSDKEKALQWFKSSSEAQRGFCSTCSSSIFFRSSHWLGELHIARSLVSGVLDREPAGHSFYDTHVDWMSLDDKLARKGG